MKILPILLLTTILLLAPISVQEGETFNSTVYTPNGTRYIFSIKFDEVGINKTTGEIIYVKNKTISGFLELNSKFLTAGYQAWGATINITTREYSNGKLEDTQSFNVSIPPILAIKEGTRKIYPTTILIKFMRGEYEDPKEAIRDLSNNQPVEDFYVYNPFYIPTNVKEGDKIPYGYWNKTANQGVIVYGKIVKSTELSIDGNKYDTWVVDLFSGIQELLEEFNETEDNVPGEINATLNLYYEKTTGWLLKVEALGNSEFERDNTTVVKNKIVGIAEIKELGSIVIGGMTYIERLANLPPYTSLVISTIGIIGAILIVVQRLKK